MLHTNYMSKKIFSLFFIFILVTNCSNRDNIAILQKGDINLSCEQLKTEINQVDKKLKKAKFSKRNKKVKNWLSVLLTPFTAFLSLIFLDASDKQKEEIGFYNKRRVHLIELKENKPCL